MLEHFQFHSCAIRRIWVGPADEDVSGGIPRAGDRVAAEGSSSVEIAEAIGVSSSWVDSIKRLHESGGALAPKSRANKRKSLAEREGARITARVAEHPGTTLKDLKRDLKLTASISNLWYVLRDLGLSLKKNLRAAERDRPDVVVARAAGTVVHAGIDPRRLVFLDETFGSTTMTRLYGWGPTTQRVVDSVPHGHWKTTTFVVAVRSDMLAAEIELLEARVKLAESTDRSALVGLLDDIVRKHQEGRDILEKRVKIGVASAGELTRADAALAEAKVRLVGAKVEKGTGPKP